MWMANRQKAKVQMIKGHNVMRRLGNYQEGQEKIALNLNNADLFKKLC